MAAINQSESGCFHSPHSQHSFKNNENKNKENCNSESWEKQTIIAREKRRKENAVVTRINFLFTSCHLSCYLLIYTTCNRFSCLIYIHRIFFVCTRFNIVLTDVSMYSRLQQNYSVNFKLILHHLSYFIYFKTVKFLWHNFTFQNNLFYSDKKFILSPQMQLQWGKF